jgi:tetrahydromethanopterin S-methyltransferase subunit G
MRIKMSHTSSNKVSEEEKDGESNEDTEIPPSVRRVVRVRLDDVGRTLDDVGSRCSSESGTDSRIGRNIGVLWALGNKGRTSKFSVVEFIDHQCLESVCDRVDVVDPSRPAQHVCGWNGETSVHD